METKYRNRFRIKTARLKNWDYGSHGHYFITICTKNRQCYFGDIVHNVGAHGMHNIKTRGTNNIETHNYASLLRPTEIGNIAYQYWKEIPHHFPFVEVDEFVIMPDHVHGVLFLNKPDYHDWKPNQFKPQSKNLASIIRGYKSSVKRYAVLHSIEFEWQSRYYDRVIHSEPDLHVVRQYIEDNPIKWLLATKSIEL